MIQQNAAKLNLSKRSMDQVSELVFLKDLSSDIMVLKIYFIIVMYVLVALLCDCITVPKLWIDASQGEISY